jgi:spore coat polysaccharide biosynthesis protein SpsF
LSGDLKNKLKKITPHIGIITQARMTSTRLPSKVLKQINERPLLDYHWDRLQKTGFEIAIATTINKEDEPICEFAKKKNIPYHRGSEKNVLSRFYETAVKFNYDIIIRVTSDCPLIDPHLIRNSASKYIQFNNPNLYLSNAIERTFARGFDFEIFSFEALELAFKNASEESDLEHVTPYILKNRSGKTEYYHVKQEQDNSRFRITVDTEDDFKLVKTLIETYKADKLPYTEIENILSLHPELTKINSHVEQKKI